METDALHATLAKQPVLGFLHSKRGPVGREVLTVRILPAARGLWRS